MSLRLESIWAQVIMIFLFQIGDFTRFLVEKKACDRLRVPIHAQAFNFLFVLFLRKDKCVNHIKFETQSDRFYPKYYR